MAGCLAGRLWQREALVRRYRGAAGGSEGHGGSGLTRAATPSVGAGVGAAAAAAYTRQRDELGRRLVGETGEIHQLFLAALQIDQLPGIVAVIDLDAAQFDLDQIDQCLDARTGQAHGVPLVS